MRVGDCDGERIRGVRTCDLHSREQPRDHRVDLRLFSAPRADHGLLDQPGSLFADLDPGARRAHQHHSACLAELQRRLRVLVDEHFLDRRGSRRMVGEKRFKLVGQRRETAWQRRIAVGLDLAISQVSEAIALGLD
jgi:hypothetical protein